MMTEKFDPTLPHWWIMTKSEGGVVSVIRDLTLRQAQQIYNRFDPFYGLPPLSAGSGIMMRVNDGDIVLREIFGPPGWPAKPVSGDETGDSGE